MISIAAARTRVPSASGGHVSFAIGSDWSGFMYGRAGQRTLGGQVALGRISTSASPAGAPIGQPFHSWRLSNS